MSETQKRAVLHLTIGDDSYSPTQHDLDTLVDMFQSMTFRAENETVPVKLEVVSEPLPVQRRTLIHVTAGDENWAPTTGELLELANTFAEGLKVGAAGAAVVATRNAVTATVIDVDSTTDIRAVASSIEDAKANDERLSKPR